MKTKLDINKERRFRPETLLRLLISTSYPQNMLSNIVIDICNNVTIEEDNLESIISGLNIIEKEFDMLDFVRCVEIKRNKEEFKIIVKCLDFDPNLKKITDNKENHIVRFSINVITTSPLSALDNTASLASLLLEYFYRSQVKSNKNTNIGKVKWSIRTHDGDTVENKIEPIINVLETLKESLNKYIFNVILTQNAILLPDQRKRIWGDFRRS